MQEEIREIEDKVSQAQDLVKELAKKKFAFDAEMQVEKQEAFPHTHALIKLTLTSGKPGTKRINHRIRSIVVTKGKVHVKQGDEIAGGSKVDFGDNEK